MSFTTQVLPLEKKSINLAASLLQDGEVVAIPTETVYGLAADALNEEAVEKIFVAKGRPQDNPLIVHVSNFAMLQQVVSEIYPNARALAEAFWPGPLTMILPKSSKVSSIVSAGLDTVGVRMPSHKGAREIISAAMTPLAAPSANLSGSPSPTTAQHVYDDMQGRIPLIIDGGSSSVGLESTVISLVGNPIVLRPGFITQNQIEEVLKCEVLLADAVTAPLKEGETAASPGMKYKHYSPKANIILVDGSIEEFAKYIEAQAEENLGTWALCFEEDVPFIKAPAITYGSKDNSTEQATALFGALRALDENGAKIVYARMPKQNDVGLAVYNRLLRAAAFQIVEL